MRFVALFAFVDFAVLFVCPIKEAFVCLCHSRLWNNSDASSRIFCAAVVKNRFHIIRAQQTALIAVTLS